jgi:hypothetical protein
MMERLAHVLDGGDTGGLDRVRALVERTWAAEAAIRRISLMEDDDSSAREVLVLLREIRYRTVGGLQVGLELREGLWTWRSLWAGWFDSVRQQEQAAAAAAADEVRSARGAVIGEAVQQDEKEEPPQTMTY